jgi:hypothetical protein
MNTSQFTLENYIKKILELKEQAFAHSLDREQLREVAAELGLSDWAYVESRAEGYFKMAKEHLQFRNFDKAIKEAEKSLEICPYEAKYAFFLADTYKQKWIVQGKSENRIKALDYAQYCLNQQPNHEGAMYLQAALSSTAFEKLEVKTSEKKWFKIAIAAIVILCSAYGGFLGHSLWQAKQNAALMPLTENRLATQESMQIFHSHEEPYNPEFALEQTQVNRVQEETYARRAAQQNLSIVLDDNITAQGLFLATERAELETFETAYALRLKGKLKSKEPFRKIWLTAELLDKDGMTIKKDLIQIKPKTDVYQGEFHHLSHEEEVLPEAYSLRIAVESIEI